MCPEPARPHSDICWAQTSCAERPCWRDLPANLRSRIKAALIFACPCARGDRHAYTLGRVDRTDAYKGLFQLGWKECGRVIYFLPRGRTKAWFLRRQGNLEPLFRPA